MFRVVLREEIFKKDFRRIDREHQKLILRIIRKKLTTHPELYGKPLSGNLKDCWKLKTGPYRIVYRILKMQVTVDVITIGFRRNKKVYLQAAKRLGLI